MSWTLGQLEWHDIFNGDKFMYLSGLVMKLLPEEDTKFSLSEIHAKIQKE